FLCKFKGLKSADIKTIYPIMRTNSQVSYITLSAHLTAGKKGKSIERSGFLNYLGQKQIALFPL
ncbi:MAG: hypothetical protein NTV04_18780, partial [Deltaproteobacteria bacterium]|nr:hypothetical protein [Deltaproteobacteria bacterium]